MYISSKPPLIIVPLITLQTDETRDNLIFRENLGIETNISKIISRKIKKAWLRKLLKYILDICFGGPQDYNFEI